MAVRARIVAGRYVSYRFLFFPFFSFFLPFFFAFRLVGWPMASTKQDWESFGLASIGGGVGDWSQPQQKERGEKDEDRLTADRVPAVKEAVRKWAELQAGQRILVTTPSVVVGYRCQVYRSEGATQWYTAVIVGHDEDTGVSPSIHHMSAQSTTITIIIKSISFFSIFRTQELTLTDDTVLEEHYEDPRLLQIKLLGEGVVESILRGETVGITSRRSRAASQVPYH